MGIAGNPTQQRSPGRPGRFDQESHPGDGEPPGRLTPGLRRRPDRDTRGLLGRLRFRWLWECRTHDEESSASYIPQPLCLVKSDFRGVQGRISLVGRPRQEAPENRSSLNVPAALTGKNPGNGEGCAKRLCSRLTGSRHPAGQNASLSPYGGRRSGFLQGH